MKKPAQLIIPPCSVLRKPLFISFQTYPSQFQSYFSKDAFTVFLDLYQKTVSDPEATLPLLQQFSQQHPNVPMVWNLLTYSYTALKQVSLADQLIRQTHEKFPEYLLGKINYADLLLRNKKWAEIPAVFDHITDLSALHPQRQEFHYSEVRGFMTAMGFYHHEIHKRPQALEYFRIAVQAEPTHPSLLILEKKLFYRPMTRIIKSYFRSLVGL